MNINSNNSFNSIYLLQPNLSYHQLFDAIEACLCKAEAIATAGTLIKVDLCDSTVLINYLWTLSDLIHEANFLHARMFQKEILSS